MSFTQSWAVTALGSLLTGLWTPNPRPAEKWLELEARAGGQESFHSSGSAHHSRREPSYPVQPAPPLPERVSATCKLRPRSPAGVRGSSLRLPCPACLACHSVGAFPAGSRCSGIKKSGSGCPFWPPRLLQPGPGVISPGLVQGASSVPPAGKWKCASWIAAAATAVAGDEEAVATPAGKLGRRAEARGSESRAPASLALRRATLRGPRATARPPAPQ